MPSPTAILAALWITSSLTAAIPLAQQPAPSVQASSGQVSINLQPDTDANIKGPLLTPSATIFTSVPGPRQCRGNIMTTLALPQPRLGSRTGAHCYSLPSIAGCGVFMANKDDGCEVRLFTEAGCVGFVNLAVFVPEERPVGGTFRSVSVECGIPAPDPASLGSPPLQGMMIGVKRPGKG